MPTSAADVHHLLRRAGFGATAAELPSLQALERADLIEWVLRTDTGTPDVRPSFLDDTTLSDYERRVRLTWWWFDRMATTTRPFHEKMTLFWHGHFVSSSAKVSKVSDMHDQNALFRASGRGLFRPLAQAMALQPAMLIYLDNKDNVSGRPNENFARELMELFLVGPGQYTQADVVASARAWTGHGLAADGTYLFRSDRHDGGQKTFLGITQNWDGPQIIDQILLGVTRPAAARFIAKKLWSFLAYPNPETTVLDGIAETFLAADLDITALARAIFSRSEFWSVGARNGLVRSPVEWIAAVMRATGLPAATVHPEWWSAGMGQEVFLPPNVSGWKQNAYWISPSATSSRLELARYITWQLYQSPFLQSTQTLPVATAIQAAFDAFNIDQPSPATRAALEGWLTRQRQQRYTGWAEQPNLTTLMPLTPDLQMA